MRCRAAVSRGLLRSALQAAAPPNPCCWQPSAWSILRETDTVEPERCLHCAKKPQGSHPASPSITPLHPW